MMIRLARKRAFDRFECVKETRTRSLLLKPPELARRCRIPIAAAICDQSVCARHMKRGKGRRLTACIRFERRGMMRGCIPAVPVDACVYRVTPEEKVVVADRAGAQQTTARERCGKVCEVLFDCHGEFTGFVLEDCCEKHVFHSRARDIGSLAVKACRYGLTLCVWVHGKNGEKIRKLAIKA